MLINEIGSRDLQTQKKAIKKAVDQEDSQEILDRVESTLQSGELAQRLGAVLKQDTDTKKLYRLVSQVIVNVPSALDDKLKFIENFPKGFVKISTLMSPGVVTDFSKSIPDPFAYRVFMALKDVVIQGVGPGEFALAALSPRIKSMGQRSGGGDLLINGVNVEVKGARQGEGGKISGGRWTDPRKANFNLAPIRDLLTQYYNFSPDAKSLTGAGWVALRDGSTVSKQNQKKLVAAIVRGNFAKYQGPALADVEQALMTGDEPAIRRAWARACYENYKSYSGFAGMLILDFSKNSSLYFSDYEDGEQYVKIQSVQLWGPEQSTAPQVSLKGPAKATAKTGDQDAASEKQPEKTKAAPAPIRARFEPAKPADTGARKQR